MNNQHYDDLSDKKILLLMIIGALAGAFILPVIILILSAFGL